MQKFSLEIPNDLIISSNRQALVWKRKKLKDYCAGIIPEAAAGLVPMGRAIVYVGVTKRTKGKYDPANLADTCKPIVDELVKVGVLDEDDYEHVLGPFLFHDGVDKRLVGRMLLTVYLAKFSGVPF